MGDSQYIAWGYDESATESGAECVYYSHALLLGDQWWGIKAYKTASERSRASSRQQHACKHGFGPPVGSCVRVLVQRRGRKPLVRHGYYTGQCRPFVEVTRDEVGKEVKDPNIEHIKLLARRCGFVLDDAVARNFGWWMGSLVLLDFGEYSFEHTQ